LGLAMSSGDEDRSRSVAEFLGIIPDRLVMKITAGILAGIARQADKGVLNPLSP